jgi:uncharacterized protein (TIGR00299 family) protein
MTPRHLHFDCYCGISGDMTLGALVDLGVSVEDLQRGLARLPIGPFALVARKVKRQGIIATQVDVQVDEGHAHRHLKHIYEIVDKGALPPRVLERAKVAYRKLAEAEAHVHASTPEKIHFHEVGAKDAILDVAGAMLGFELLGIESFSAGAVVVGSGTVKCAHGVMPVPAPATAELLKGMPHRAGAWEYEMATPTGVAILGTVLGEGGRPLAQGFVSGETALIAEKIGYGAGTRIIEGCPNFLRLMLCSAAPASLSASIGSPASVPSVTSVWSSVSPVPSASPPPNLPIERDQILALECEIDDMSPEVAGYVMEQLFTDGALDVQFSPVQMKKKPPRPQPARARAPRRRGRAGRAHPARDQHLRPAPRRARPLGPAAPQRGTRHPLRPRQDQARPLERSALQGRSRIRKLPRPRRIHRPAAASHLRRRSRRNEPRLNLCPKTQSYDSMSPVRDDRK